MKKTTSFAMFFGAIYFLSATLALGQPAATASLLLPIDALEAALFTKPRVDSAERAARAFADLERKAWSKARAQARSLEKNARYADYGYWIQGQAALREGEQRLSGGVAKAAEVLRLADDARRLFRQVEFSNPYSPLIKNLQKDIGLADILAGRAQLLLAKWPAALRGFELGFQRLGSAALSELPAEVVGGYGSACQKTVSNLCRPWSFRLSSAFVKGTEEAKVLNKFFPDLANRSRPPGYDVKTRAYRAPDLDLAAFNAAMDSYWSRDYGKTVEAFQKFLDEFPKSVYRFRARYWLAQALKNDGDVERAQVVLSNLQIDSPLTYYGLLASHESGIGLERGIGVTLPLGSVSDAQLLPLEQVRLQRAEELLRVGGGALAVLELRDLNPRGALSAPFLAYLLMLNHRAGNHLGAFRIINDLLARGYEGLPSSYVLKVIFPTPFMELVEKYSREQDLDPLLVISLIKQESSFGWDAVSGSGALGLMQLMPATAFETMPGVGRLELQKAEANMKVGTRYLKQLMNRFKGNIILSLAGYNAGPNAVDRWLKQIPADRSATEMVESIPYRETREYVAAIIRNHYWYSKRTGAPVRGLEYFWNTTTVKKTED